MTAFICLNRKLISLSAVILCAACALEANTNDLNNNSLSESKVQVIEVREGVWISEHLSNLHYMRMPFHKLVCLCCKGERERQYATYVVKITHPHTVTIGTGTKKSNNHERQISQMDNLLETKFCFLSSCFQSRY